MNSFLSRARTGITYALVLAAMGGMAASSARAQDLSGDERRFIQIFAEDAAVVENLWLEGQVRWQNLDAGDNRLTFGPVIAFSPLDKLEIGGRVDFIDVDYGPISKSGLGDTTVYGKWQFFRNPVQFALGGEVSLPTGDEDDGLLMGTGEVDFAVFGSVRKNLEEAYLTGHLGFRFNNDANVGSSVNASGTDVNLDGETSVFLGGGAMFPLADKWAVGGELTVETERYDETDSVVELTASGYWFPKKTLTLRSGLGIGLADGEPDWEFIFGIVGHF